MEEESKVIKEKYGNVFVGVILSILGGVICTVPWVLLYVYANLIYSALAIIIAVGAFGGYKLSKAKIGKGVPVLVGIVSVLSVTLATLVVIPLLLIAKEGQSMSLENLKFLYQFDEFKSAIIRDYIISLAFTALGISGIIANIVRQIKNGVASKDITAIDNRNPYATEENIKKLKDVFVKYNAMDKMHLADKKDILNDVDFENKDIVFRYLRSMNVIKKKKGKFYFSETAEANSGKKKKRETIIAVIIVCIALCVLIVMGIFTGDNSENDASFINQNVIRIDESNIKLNIPEDLIMLSEEDINLMYGEGACDFYNLVAFNNTFTKAIYCFKIDINDEELAEDSKTPEAYLKLLYQEVLDKTIISEKTMVKKHWFVAEYEEENQGVMYKEDFAICEENGKFLCVNLIYPKDDGMQLEKIIRK